MKSLTNHPVLLSVTINTHLSLR